ncbi:MAG: SDR family NAD(P)-dependent oxidoreductase [Actinobacteria bacterium]|nr:SDR family NAD(P)-dependent oxidoreductase [Actinomycetota bacterium]
MAPKTAVVTGASSGIGAACARQLVEAGFSVVVGARRLPRLHEVADPIGATARSLDVTDQASVDSFCAEIDECHVLVNNAGGALGLEPIAETVDEKWEQMFHMNVMGPMRMTRALLPKLIASGDGQVITIGSIAGHESYPGGGGYNAAKHGIRAVMHALRQELLGQPVRVTQIDPGMVETEFSIVRFGGDADRASTVYRGVEALTADDVAACVVFAATRPSHVNIDALIVKPRDQASATNLYRRPS